MKDGNFFDKELNKRFRYKEEKVPGSGGDGEPGPPGKDGIDGKDGKDGKDGEQGPPGKDGINGKDGKDGEPGPPGKDGEPGGGGGGEPGPPGKDGKDGEQGPPGKDGIDGKDGKDGEPGLPGKDGEDGADLSPTLIDYTLDLAQLIHIQMVATPNTYYKYGYLRTLEITDYRESIYPVIIWFSSDSPATTLTIPSTIIMTDFTINANKHYELSIINGYLTCVEFEL